MKKCTCGQISITELLASSAESGITRQWCDNCTTSAFRSTSEVVVSISCARLLAPAVVFAIWIDTKNQNLWQKGKAVHTNQVLAHISKAVMSVSCSPSQCQLCTSDCTNYIVPRTRTKFSERVFSVAGPYTWISLLEHIRSATNEHCFKHYLNMPWVFKCHFCWLCKCLAILAYSRLGKKQH